MLKELQTLEKWKNKVEALNAYTFNNSISNSQDCLGYYSIDGKLNEKTEILIIGYNPGLPGGDNNSKKIEVFETFNSEKDYVISYLECLKEDYRYHLAEKTTGIFRKAELNDEEIEDLYSNKTTKTNLYHLISKDLNSLKTLFKDQESWGNYRDKMHLLMYEFIKTIQPKLVLIEGKTTWSKFIIDTYETWNRTWNESNHFGYFFDGETEFVGYHRNQSTDEAAKVVKEILDQRFKK